MASFSTTALISLLFLLLRSCSGSGLPKSDVDLLEFPLNLEYLEADFFSWGAFGSGTDSFEPNLTKGGPEPLGAKKANLTPLIKDIIAQFAFQEFGHLRFTFILLINYVKFDHELHHERGAGQSSTEYRDSRGRSST